MNDGDDESISNAHIEETADTEREPIIDVEKNDDGHESVLNVHVEGTIEETIDSEKEPTDTEVNDGGNESVSNAHIEETIDTEEEPTDPDSDVTDSSCISDDSDI